MIVHLSRALTTTLALVFSVFVSSPLAEARLGETRQQLERRMVDNRTVIRYPKEEIDSKLDRRDVFYRNMFDLLPDGVEHVVYYKRAEREQASVGDLRDTSFPDGWDLHVIYVRGVSVLECYRRNGAGLSQAEVNALLSVNQDDSFWRRANEVEAQPSAIKYEWIRDDGAARAVRNRNMVLFINSNFDEKMKELIDQAVEARRNMEQELAPDSVAGF